MATEETTTTAQTPAAKTEGTPAATQTPAAVAKPAEQAPAATQTPAATEPPAKKEPTRATLADDGDLPDVDLIDIPTKALKKRLDKAGRAELNRLYEKYEVKDADELLGLVKEAREGRAAKEEARKAQLTKEEKLEEERLQIAAERDEWRTKYERQVQMVEVREQSSAMAKVAAQYIDPEFIDDELPKLAKYLTSKYSDEELKDLQESVVQDYWKDLAAKRPKIAIGKAEEKKPPERQALSNGAVDKNPPEKKPESQQPKSFAPKRDAQGRTIETPEERRAALDAMRARGLSI